jgi:hypothetical protein
MKRSRSHAGMPTQWCQCARIPCTILLTGLRARSRDTGLPALASRSGLHCLQTFWTRDLTKTLQQVYLHIYAWLIVTLLKCTCARVKSLNEGRTAEQMDRVWCSPHHACTIFSAFGTAAAGGGIPHATVWPTTTAQWPVSCFK